MVAVEVSLEAVMGRLEQEAGGAEQEGALEVVGGAEGADR
jgi:hypothetical protein